MQIATDRERVVAVLGPTNTGKTYLAFERMLGHGSGVMGFPLRLLARENYDRAVAAKGSREVALITGEEKIVPPYARYFFCTVESMPMERETAFVGIDEVQLAADPDRGHIFTDRILRARGTEETMFMGAESIKPRLNQLVPNIEFMSRPRFSRLSYAGHKKIVRLPARSAVVGFSAADVYAVAELIRRQRGGAAIVMGALSPRTRNAQVALFQNGDVDYLVATDAIGMGLNMDIDHVAFAALGKFDGHDSRGLRPEELAQIAGRAGRHMSDGTFGTTGDAGEIEPEVIERIESHEFDRLRQICWRNPVLDFSTLVSLGESLRRAPDLPGLVRVREAQDERAFADLAQNPAIADRAAAEGDVRLLWDVCQIPDFQKLVSDTHVRLLGQVYTHLMDGNGRLPDDWVAGHVSNIDRPDGDIETLLGRISRVRIWTYISHRADWLNDPETWQGRTREIEDKLSDALHDRLTQRFVDQRTAVLMKRLQDREDLTALVDGSGDVLVEGHYVGRMDGFRFTPDRTGGDLAGRAVTNAAMKALDAEINRRIVRLEKAAAGDLVLNDQGLVEWEGQALARLLPGRSPLLPKLGILGSELLDGTARGRVERVLDQWLRNRIATDLEPLVRATGSTHRGPVRGLIFRLEEGLGNIRREEVAEELTNLSQEDRAALRQFGVRIGRESLYLPRLLKPKSARLAAILSAVHGKFSPIPPIPPAGRSSVRISEADDPQILGAAGYRVLGQLAVRIDLLERLLSLVWKDLPKTPAKVTPEMLNLLGCGEEDMDGVLTAIGLRRRQTVDGVAYFPPRHRAPGSKKGKRKSGPSKETVNADSPFAKLREIVDAR